MAKRETIPADIAKKFSKPQYVIDQPVCFTWLGQKMYGYVRKITQTETKISYLVETKNCKYPVGLEIDGYKTSETGNISYERTKSTSPEFIRDNITSTNFATIFTNIRREEITSTDDSRTVGTDTTNTNSAVLEKRKKSSSKNASKSSNRTNSKTDTKRTKRSTKKLESIQKPKDQVDKQKNFLKKFI